VLRTVIAATRTALNPRSVSFEFRRVSISRGRRRERWTMSTSLRPAILWASVTDLQSDCVSAVSPSAAVLGHSLSGPKTETHACAQRRKPATCRRPRRHVRKFRAGPPWLHVGTVGAPRGARPARPRRHGVDLVVRILCRRCDRRPRQHRGALGRSAHRRIDARVGDFADARNLKRFGLYLSCRRGYLRPAGLFGRPTA